jgi:hypothetical protein
VKAENGKTYWCIVPTQVSEIMPKAWGIPPKPLIILREASAQELSSLSNS